MTFNPLSFNGNGAIVANVTATGTVQGDAAALSVGHNVVTPDIPGTGGVIMPSSVPIGSVVYIFSDLNGGPAHNIWPESGAEILYLGVSYGTDAATSSYSGHSHKFVKITSTSWWQEN